MNEIGNCLQGFITPCVFFNRHSSDTFRVWVKTLHTESLLSWDNCPPTISWLWQSSITCHYIKEWPSLCVHFLSLCVLLYLRGQADEAGWPAQSQICLCTGILVVLDHWLAKDISCSTFTLWFGEDVSWHTVLLWWYLIDAFLLKSFSGVMVRVASVNSFSISTSEEAKRQTVQWSVSLHNICCTGGECGEDLACTHCKSCAGITQLVSPWLWSGCIFKLSL